METDKKIITNSSIASYLIGILYYDKKSLTYNSERQVNKEQLLTAIITNCENYNNSNPVITLIDRIFVSEKTIAGDFSERKKAAKYFDH